MTDFQLNCPLPFEEDQRISLAHGSGGRRMAWLIDEVIRPHFPTMKISNNHDGALLGKLDGHVVLTTDSFVVVPHFFPGGNIGKLAINGTVNDLAMCGATPAWLTCSFILEEGFSMESFRQILVSMGQTANQAGTGIVTGDTKVVDKGKGDGIFINTAGVGRLLPGANIQPANVAIGDEIVINGPVGNHGMTIMSQREHLAVSGNISSDCRSLAQDVTALIEAFGEDIHCLRDMTRGGLASTMNEIATAADVTLELSESAIPVDEAVRNACEIFGLDPLYVANEGKFAAFVASGCGDPVARHLNTVNALNRAAVIGTVVGQSSAPVILSGILGVSRILDMLSGDQLPRIC